MDLTAMHQLTYGLYVITAQDGEHRGGCVVNTLSQVTSSPAKLSVTINKDNYTCELVKNSGRFAAVVLTEQADMDLIGGFGFRTGRDVDKFMGHDVQTDGAGVPYVAATAAARFSCKVVDQLDVGSHIMFIGLVEEAENLGGDPMSYAYYHKVKKGTTPKNAPSYQEVVEKKGFRCTVCGHVAELDAIPDGFTCPVCGVPGHLFEKIG
ncbi:MAG: flavin reductase [Clostridiales bacterium]|nr:flavin reductase [Clostridiales bacterium]